MTQLCCTMNSLKLADYSMDKQPILKTDRLVLRPFEVADAPNVKKLAGDKLIADMTANIPHPYLEGMAEHWISSHPDNYQYRNTVVFAITLRETSELMGAVSISQISGTTGNLAYWIGIPYWGNGYCTEAAKEIIKFGFENYDLNDLYAIHLPENPASGNVMKKNGFTYIKDVKVGDRTMLHYELVKPG